MYQVASIVETFLFADTESADRVPLSGEVDEPSLDPGLISL